MKFSDEKETEIFDKIHKTIISCTNEYHIDVCRDMIIQFSKLVSDKNSLMIILLSNKLRNKRYEIEKDFKLH